MNGTCAGQYETGHNESMTMGGIILDRKQVRFGVGHGVGVEWRQ